MELINILYILIVALILIVIVLAILYIQRENVINYLNSSEYGKALTDKVFGSSIESLKAELKTKCETEKLDLKSGAEAILTQKLNEKEIQIQELKNSNLNLQEISDKLNVCEQEKIKLKEDMNTAFKSLLEKQENSSIKIPTPWTCGVEGIYTPLRVNENKDIECMAIDGKNCLWTTDINSCKKIRETPPAGEIKPLTCGDMYKGVYGDDGYSNPNNWCSIAAKTYNLGK